MCDRDHVSASTHTYTMYIIMHDVKLVMGDQLWLPYTVWGTIFSAMDGPGGLNIPPQIVRGGGGGGGGRPVNV